MLLSKRSSMAIIQEDENVATAAESANDDENRDDLFQNAADQPLEKADQDASATASSTPTNSRLGNRHASTAEENWLMSASRPTSTRE